MFGARQKTLLCLLLAPLCACEDDKSDPPNEPTFVGPPTVECRKIEGVVKLDKVSFLVRELDGVEDLREPFVIVEATRLAMTEQPTVTPEPDGDDCKADDGKCDVVYAWEWSRDSEQIYCGEAGDQLRVNIEVQDLDRHVVRGNRDSKIPE